MEKITQSPHAVNASTGKFSEYEALATGPDGIPDLPKEPPKPKANGNGKAVCGEDSLIEWREPVELPSRMQPVDPFREKLLPRVYRGHVMDVSERMQCPPDYLGASLMVGTGSLVGRQLAIRPREHDDWTIPPNLWGCCIGRPGVMKSPAINAAMRFIELLQELAGEEHKIALRNYKAELMVYDEQKKQSVQQIRSALKNKADGKPEATKANGGLNAKELALQAVGDGEPEEPGRRRYVTQDPTIEKLGELLRDNPRGLLLKRDELVGWLLSLDQEGREKVRAFWLEAWNGYGKYVWDTIGRKMVEFEATCMSILGGATPGTIKAYLDAAMKGGMADDGLIQRFQMTVWPDHSRKYVHVDRPPDRQAYEAVKAVFERLDRIDARALGAELCPDGGVPFLRFAPDAQEYFNELHAAREHWLRQDHDSPAFESHIAKYRSLLPSLALLIHLVQSPEGGPVSLDALSRAADWMVYLESHARRLYSLSLAPEIEAAHALDKKILAGKVDSPFSARDVYRNGWRGLDRKSVIDAVRVLQDYDRIAVVPTLAGTTGRKSEEYAVNPALLTPSGKS